MERPNVRVKHSPSRCPFCHEDVSSVQAIVCRDCLARHHRACWEEQGSCASCHSTHRLVPAEHPRGTLSERRGRPQRQVRPEASGFLGLNQTGLILFVALFMTCLPLAFLPWLIPSMREGS